MFIYIYFKNWGVHSKITPIKIHIEITRDHGNIYDVQSNPYM